MFVWSSLINIIKFSEPFLYETSSQESLQYQKKKLKTRNREETNEIRCLCISVCLLAQNKLDSSLYSTDEYSTDNIYWISSIYNENLEI